MYIYIYIYIFFFYRAFMYAPPNPTPGTGCIKIPARQTCICLEKQPPHNCLAEYVKSISSSRCSTCLVEAHFHLERQQPPPFPLVLSRLISPNTIKARDQSGSVARSLIPRITRLLTTGITTRWRCSPRSTCWTRTAHVWQRVTKRRFA